MQVFTYKPIKIIWQENNFGKKSIIPMTQKLFTIICGKCEVKIVNAQMCFKWIFTCINRAL